MVRQRNTPSCGLDRSKSTSSGGSVHLEHIRPAQAELDAHAAAMLAFTRAQERSSAETAMWPPQRQSVGSYTSNNSPGKSPSDQAVHRRQSIRFVRSRPQADRAQTAPVDRDSFHSQTSSSGENNETKSSTSRPLSTSSVADMATSEDFANTLIMSEEHYTPMDDIASVPSSYRRIRKSKSMFNTPEPSIKPEILGYGEVRPSSTTNQLPWANPKHSATMSRQSPPTETLKQPKSMSFLGSRREDSTSIVNSQRGASSQRWANDYQGNLSGKSGNKRSHSSTFFRPKSPSADKAFRKTMRSSDEEAPTASIRHPGDGSLRIKARKVSQNFKHKLKSLFSSRKSENSSPPIPCQQTRTRNKYSQLPQAPTSDFGAMFGPGPSFGDDAAISRVVSGVPSLHAVPSYREVRSRKGSVNSLESDGRASDEKSRVTSWSNSETESSMTVNSQRGEWIRQRLSVIKENGTHVPSSSSRYPRGTGQQTAAIEDDVTPHASAIMDSQRIYSALMKRLEQSQQEEEKTIVSFAGPVAVPRRTSSRASQLDSSSRNSQNSVASFSTCSSLSQSVSGHCSSVRRQRHNALSSSASAPSSGEPNNESATDGSARKLRQPRSQSSIRTISARNSAFFGSPACHLFRTKSPYRRAIQDAMKDAETASQPKSPEYNPWMRSLNNLPIRRPSTSESDVDQKMQYAESIYSSNTDELPHNSRNTASLVESFPQPPPTHGDATIFVEPFVHKPTPAAASKHRVTSSGSSIEWKTWLSAKVSKLEGSPSSQYRADDGFKYAPSGRIRLSGHVRESAQIMDGEDEEILESYQPTTPVSALNLEKLNLSQRSPKPRPSPRDTSPTPLKMFAEEANQDCLGYSAADPETLSARSPSVHSDRPRTLSNGSRISQSRLSLKKPLTPSRSLRVASGSQQADKGSVLTAKLVRRRSRARPRSLIIHDSDQDLATAVEKQFGKTEGFGERTGRFTMPTAMVKSENVNPHTTADDSVSFTTKDLTRASHATSPRKDNSSFDKNSQRRVDVLMNNKRRRPAGGGDEGAFV